MPRPRSTPHVSPAPEGSGVRTADSGATILHLHPETPSAGPQAGMPEPGSAEDKAGPSKQVADSETFDGAVFAPVLEQVPARPVQQALKRAFDVGFSLAALTAGAPLLAGIAVAVKANSPGPVLYKQVRVGKNGTLFNCLKFRSMVVNAEQGRPQWASHSDPRVTRVGGILRRTSLDELPQIWNVLVGDMSWIGPRPERPVFVARFRREMLDYDLRHTVAPGLSGWAQVNGLRGNVSIAERTAFDVYYVRHFSLALDAKIFLRTFATVIAGE